MKTVSDTLPELKEKALHGDIFLPLKKYTCELHPLFPSVPLHWHEEMEFTRIMDGTAHYQVGNTDFEVHAGDLILVPPHILHQVTQIDRAYMRSETFVFHMNFLLGGGTDACSLKYLKPISDGSLSLPSFFAVSCSEYRTLNTLFEQLYSCYTQKPYGYELILKSLFFDLFRFLFQQGAVITTADSAPKTARSDKLKEILQYMEDHFSDELSIPSLAASCHLSASYVMHFFKEETGMTVTEYWNGLRLRRAAALLEKEDCTIIDAALSCGFNNISYFHKRFKEYYGMTPKHFLETIHAPLMQAP